MYFPSDYNYQNDPTYILAVKNRVNISNKFDSSTVVLKDVNFGKLANIKVGDYDLEKLGEWNYQLLMMSEKEMRNPITYLVYENFANMGIMAKVFLFGDTVYTFLVLPPFIALYWDDFNKQGFLGSQAAGSIVMNPARVGFTTFMADLDTYVAKNIQDHRIADDYYGTIGEGIQGIYKDFLDTTIPSGPYQAAYVPVFGYSTDIKAPFLALNCMFHISKRVFESYKSPSTNRLIPKVDMDFKKIFKENIGKMTSTSGNWMDPIYVLYVAPVPNADEKLKFVERYMGFVGSNRINPQMIPEQILKSQECAEGCDIPNNNYAVGLIVHGDRKMRNVTPIDVNINCKTIGEGDLNEMAREFEVEGKEGESNYEFCQRVRDEIKKKLVTTPKNKK